MRIAISGSTGLIGSQLIPFLIAQQHDVVHIARRRIPHDQRTSFIVWNPEQGVLSPEQIENMDVVIHLAGANVGERWTKEHKAAILESRIKSTRLLCTTLAGLTVKPKLLLAASAVGYYGNHGSDIVLDERSPQGTGFLPEVCGHWEAETRYAAEAGIRVVHMRFGVVLSKSGGALAKMWMPFQCGLGGVLGFGKQMMSWIALDEIPLVIAHLIKNDKLNGAVNIVSPQPVSNKEFTKTFGGVIKRPTVFPVPGFMIQLLFGEMGQALLLEGSRVRPLRLQETGYQFKYPDLKSALEKAIR